MSTGPLTYLYKKYVARIQQTSPDAAVTVDRIRNDFGPSAGYQAALALIHCLDTLEKSDQQVDTTRYAIYLRDYPIAVPQLRRALDYLLIDHNQSVSEYKFRD